MSGAMFKHPEPGEVWLDVPAWKQTGAPRELLILEVDDSFIRVHNLSGGAPAHPGVPAGYFESGDIIFQGYWSSTHRTLPRLTPPFSGHPLAAVEKSNATKKLDSVAPLGNSILPRTYAPDDVEAFNQQFKRVHGADLDKPASSIPAGVAYLKLNFRGKPFNSLYYQKQSNAWWLVRALIPPPSSSDQSWRQIG